MKKLFNRHNTKISYRCGPNLKNAINSHNKKVFGVFRKTVLKKSNFPKKNQRKNKVNNSDNCNCEAQECPLDGDCLDSNMVYEASVSVVGRENQSPKKYIGLCKTTFKERFRSHVSSFNNIRFKKSTELSEHIWGLKDRGLDWRVKWRKVCNENHYSTTTGLCNLCLREKVEISKLEPQNAINQRTELYKACLHKWRFKLAAFNYDKEQKNLQEALSNSDNLTRAHSINEDVSQTVAQTLPSSETPIASNNVSLPERRYFTRHQERLLGNSLNH